ncbi:MAG TPA: hypothetical protein DD440_02555 [Porticoccaceae bacterium]|nr:hypothetical protein [Porticoccaceae bacterium]
MQHLDGPSTKSLSKIYAAAVVTNQHPIAVRTAPFTAITRRQPPQKMRYKLSFVPLILCYEHSDCIHQT